MRAAVLEKSAAIGDRPLRIVELPQPIPCRDELLVRVAACGICRTDLHVIEGDLAAGKRPVVPGHQIVGRVERLGPHCKRFRVGDRVGVAWLRHTCGSCRYCRSANENLCADSLYTGYHADGGYAEYAVVEEAFAYAIPDAFADAEAAPLLCAGIIGYRALQACELAAAGTLALYGFGSSAHIVLQIARHRGCSVLVATRGEQHRRLAREMGADWVGTANQALPREADAAIIFAPAGELVPPALRAVRKAGVVVLAGIYMTAVPAMEYEPHLFHEKKLRSVEANTRQDGENLLSEAAAAGICPQITTFPPEQANEALMRLAGARIAGRGVVLL